MRKICSLVISTLLVPAALSAADLASMQEAAVADRAVVQRYMTNVEKSARDVTLAKGGYYPSVDLFYATNSLDEDSTTEHENNSIAGAKVSWNVFAGFRDRYGLRSAEQMHEVEQLRLAGIRQDIRLGVALGYLNVYDRLANLKVAEDAFKTLEKIYQDGKNRYEVGLIGQNELLRFRVDYDNADITAKAAQAGVERSVNDLSRTIGATVSLGELGFGEFSQIPGMLEEDRYLELMLAERSELQALKGVLAAADWQVKASYASYYPQVDLVGSYQNYDDNYVNGAGDISEDEVRLQAQVSMNLFRGFTKEAVTGKAKLEKRGLQYDLKELEDGYVTELHNLFIDYRVSLENVEVAKRSIEQAEENLRITQLKYNEGLQRESDLLDAIANLSRARYNQVAVIRTLFANYFRIMRMADSI